MADSDTLIREIMDFGLNEYESKVYMSLIAEGLSSAKTISDATGVPYGKIYEILNSLSEKRFVNIYPTKPMKFMAVSPSSAIESIKEQNDERLKRLENITRSRLMPIYNQSKGFRRDDPSFLVLRGRANMIKKIESMIRKAERSISICLSHNGLKRFVVHKDSLLAASENGIRINLACETSNDNMDEVKSLSFCNIRQIDDVMSGIVAIDGKECLVIEPSPDDDSIVCGRDIGVFAESCMFSKMMENLFSFRFDHLSDAVDKCA